MQLYIPLCFYYICSQKRSYDHEIHFTFHYASTISTKQEDYEYVYSFFTFHYASTISEIYMQWPGLNGTLHSTMLLLYPQLFWVALPPLDSLHSTMLLLYRPSRVTDKLGQYFFTFHYASTISSNGEIIILNQISFTFHYASTISKYCGTSNRRNRLYIPLCFYYILLRHLLPFPLIPFTFHYASTISK